MMSFKPFDILRDISGSNPVSALYLRAVERAGTRKVVRSTGNIHQNAGSNPEPPFI